MDDRNSAESEGSIHLKISELQKLSGSGTTIFAPQTGIEKRDSCNVESVCPAIPAVRAPEKELTLFALRLAVLEKAATGLGTLGFVWATVVLLGGFAITLDKTDFWFITIILLIEGTRIFSRSHELEWQHQATWSITDAGINSFRALRSSLQFRIGTVKANFRPPCLVRRQSEHQTEVTETNDTASPGFSDPQRMPTRTWKSSDVPFLPFSQWVFVSKNVSKFLYWLQLLSATACVVLSLMKLIMHNYGEVQKGDTDKRNRKSALYIFYSLALAEALLFLMEKVYWEWKVSYQKLLDEVNKECALGPTGMVSIRRFFYDAYSRCVNGSMFDGLKMDMVSFAMELLASSSPDEQLIGVRILQKFSFNERFSDDTLQKIGINLLVIERLVEMLNWTDPQDEEIRRSAADILSNLAGKKQNSLRIAGIPGAMESISSLLQTNRSFTKLSALPHILQVLRAIMSEENKLQEVMLGLAAHVFKFMSSPESSITFEKAGITEAEVADELVKILEKHRGPPIKIPRIRRFAIELAIWMMRDNEMNVHIFKDLGMENVLEGVLDTTAELESFNTFSGTVGLNRHSTTIHSLVETALKLLEEG